MKKFILSSIALISIFSFTVLPKPKAGESIIWDKTTHSFGTVKIGPELKATFTFTNKTKKSVSIKSASPSCSCTVPDYTRTPVAPGKKGIVTASYKTEGHAGSFTKTVNVEFSDGTKQELTITGNVTTDDGGPKKTEFHNFKK